MLLSKAAHHVIAATILFNTDIALWTLGREVEVEYILYLFCMLRITSINNSPQWLSCTSLFHSVYMSSTWFW